MKNLFSTLVLSVMASALSFGQMDFNPNAPKYEGSPAFPNSPMTIVATWGTVAASPVANSRSCCARIDVSGVPYLYQFGGGSLFNEVAKYNVVTNTWTPAVTTIPANISSATAITIGDSSIYLFGGESTGGLGKTLKYNVYTNSWTTLASMLTLVTDAAVVKYRDTLVYVIAGGDGLFGTTVNSAVQLYNVRTNTYVSAGTYPIAVAMMGFGIYKDTIIVAGGWTGAAATASAYKGIINPANPAVITWTAIANYPADPTGVTRIASAFVTKNTGGGILFSGGAIAGATTTTLTYMWDMCNSNWATLPALPLARSNMKAATLKGDSIAFVVSGFTGAAGTGQTDRITFSQIDGSCITPNVVGNLNPFNLQTPTAGTKITTLPFSSTPVSLTWDTSTAAATYKVIFGSPAVPPRLITLNAATNAINTTLGALDAILASAGVATGDSLIGQWDVWAFRNNPPANDSLKATNGPRSLTLKRGRPALTAFSLLTPPTGTTIVTSAFVTSPITFTWNRSGAGASYRWKFATPTFAGTIRLNTPTASDSFLTYRSSQLDSLVAGLGVVPGDSIVGQWRAYGYAGTDSLASTQTFNVTLKRALLPPCLSDFTVTRTTGITYATISSTGTSFASWRNTTNIDDNRSASTPIGFTFNYVGIDYTAFSASTNGYLDLSSSAATGSGTGAYGYVNTQFSVAAGTLLAFGPLYDDLIFPTGTAQTNMMKYQVDGSAPNRVLTVEWIGVISFSSTTGSMNFQVKLYETSNKIEFVYGPMDPGTATFSYSLGLNGVTMSAPPGLCELLTQQAANSATFSNTPQDALATMPAANSKLTFTLHPTSVETVGGTLPMEFTLSQNYPNPFNPSTTIQYALPEQSTVTLKVFNLLGQEVATLVNGVQQASYFNAVWDGRNSVGQQVSTGVYFYQLDAKTVSGKNFVSIKKMLFIK